MRRAEPCESRKSYMFGSFDKAGCRYAAGCGIVLQLRVATLLYRNPSDQNARAIPGIRQPGQAVLRMTPIERNRSDAAGEIRLIARVRAGDQQAMSELYDQYAKVVYSVALRVLQDTGAAEDVLQDIFLQLWRNPDAFDASRGSLAAWLAVIARHRAIDRLRKRRPETELEEFVIAGGPDLASEAERTLMVQKVRTVMEEMNQDQRAALEMAFFQGLTHTEIAEKTGEPLGTIKTRIRSGLQQLRQKFGG